MPRRKREIAKQRTETADSFDGIVVVDKPADWTSHDVVARARRLLRTRRIGHTGTLDPFATGVLVLLVGRATRLAQFLAGAEKEYEAVLRLGYATDTGDLTGQPRERGGVACAGLAPERIEAALAPLRGEIDQTPPMYSAKKVRGEKLYELARRGQSIEREAVRVRVRVFEILTEPGGPPLRANADGTCDLRARVVCSAGTYVRALAESVGEHLGTGAHLAALRRTRAGAFGLDRARTLEDLQALAEAGRAGESLVPIEAALPEMPSVHLTEEDAGRVRHGAPVGAAHGSEVWPTGAHVAMFDAGGRLLAIGVHDGERGLLRPRVMLGAVGK